MKTACFKKQKHKTSEIEKLSIRSNYKFWDSKYNGQVTKVIGTLMLEMDDNDKEKIFNIKKTILAQSNTIVQTRILCTLTKNENLERGRDKRERYKW